MSVSLYYIPFTLWSAFSQLDQTVCGVNWSCSPSCCVCVCVCVHMHWRLRLDWEKITYSNFTLIAWGFMKKERLNYGHSVFFFYLSTLGAASLIQRTHLWLPGEYLKFVHFQLPYFNFCVWTGGLLICRHTHTGFTNSLSSHWLVAIALDSFTCNYSSHCLLVTDVIALCERKVSNCLLLGN